MAQLMHFFNLSYFDNTIGQYILVILILLLGMAFKRVISKLSTKLLFSVFKKSALGLTQKDFYVLIKKPVSFFILLIIVYVAFSNLEYPTIFSLAPKNMFGIKMIIEKTYLILLIISLINISRKMIDFLGIIMLKKTEDKDSKTEKQLIPFAIESLKVAILILGIFIILGSVFNINVGTLIAGLGIGGLAVALAAKESLENLMGSFTIFVDKPFVTGDFVKVGTTMGTVEKVGFRSTRLRTLDKSYVTVPNKLMVDSELNNLTNRTTQRVTFNIALRYTTNPEQLRSIMSAIRDYIIKHADTTEECNVKLAELGSSSINILIIYFVESNIYQKFLDSREDINFKIMEIVHSFETEFAYPATSVYIEKGE